MADKEQNIIYPNSGGGGGDASTLNGQSGSYYLDRQNHTGTQIANTISDFAEAARLRNNHVLVKSKSDFPAAVSGVITLQDDVSYEINGLINLGTDRIETGVSNIIYGIDKSNDILLYTGTSEAITVLNNDFSLSTITLSSSTANALNLTGDNTNRAEISHCIFSSKTLATFNGGFEDLVYRNNLILNTEEGISITGTYNDIYFIDNIVKDAVATFNPTYIDFQSGTVGTLFIRGNHFELETSEVAINIVEASVTRTNIVIEENVISGNGTGLTGINANDSNVTIPSRSNVGIAGLNVFTVTIVLQTWATSSGTYLEIPETQSIKNAEFYEPNATVIQASIIASVSHEQSGRQTDIELYNLSDASSVVGSEIQTVITTGDVYQVVNNTTFAILGDKEYRMRLKRATGTGQNDALIRSATLEIRVY